MNEIDDLAILIGLLGDESERVEAEKLLRECYLRNTVAFVAHLAPYATEAETCEIAELVLAQFLTAVQRGQVQEEATVRPTIIKESRRRVALLLHGDPLEANCRKTEHNKSNQQPLLTAPEKWKSTERLRCALQGLSQDERFVLRILAKHANVPLTDLQIADALAAMDHVMTVVDIRKARQSLNTKSKEVMDAK